ncbi:MAG TPA: hydrogenase expression/formation protein HypE [Dermatophilaceae bacterium]|nr:hydrogenase expression/formation protein HypE [Dermatophilaceae bacterium]
MRTTERGRRRPPLTDTHVTLAHGAGGKSSAALTEAVFLPAFGNPALDLLGDSAVLDVASGVRLAFSTDSYVVSPIRFPGGSIGHLAVHGTVNDLAVAGAVPRWLSAAFVLEEGVAVQTLREVVADMRAAASDAGVEIVAGDTKVVPRGAADLLYVTTAGVGVVPAGRHLGAHLVRPGDAVVLSGSMGRHGMAVMLARDELAIEADITSDTAALNGLVEALLAAVPGTRWMRDATRGGVGTVANELARASGLGVVLQEERLPVQPVVRGACDLLGIDPIYVANEGLLVAVVPAPDADAAVQALRASPLGSDAVVVGEVVDGPAGLVAMRTTFGGTRLVDLLVGDPLPRIC